MTRKILIKTVAITLLAIGFASACSNLLVTPGASPDGSAILAYSADSVSLYGSLKFLPAADHAPGTMKAIHDWDSGKYLGDIQEAAHTFNVIGNMNEHQLIIGETTFGGLAQLQGQQNATMDYGSLIWTTLQRARNAREAIQVMGDLVAEYGYASEGESFSIGDTKELWVLEMIGKGPNEKGAVWVAVRIPDGHVSAHANQARIRTFPLHDPNTAIYAADVISFARKLGLFSGADAEFSFSDTYDPVTAVSARVAEARVWSFFRTVNSNMDQYLDYVQGRNLTNRMPLSIPVDAKVSLNDTFWHMRSHNEHSWFDNTLDEGAGPFHAPYRWRPLSWSHNGETYLNERTIATQQTGWHFVGQARSWMPAPIGGLIWFSMDDTATSVHVPFYSTINAIPASWAHPKNDKTTSGDLTKFSFDSAFWVFNMVANLAYPRWSAMYPEIAAKIAAKESLFQSEVAEIDEQARTVLKEKGVDATVDFLTQYSVAAGTLTTQEWLAFWQHLFVTYRDGQITRQADVATSPACGCAVSEVGYDAEWYGRIVADTGSHYLIPASETENSVLDDKPLTLSKLKYA